MGLSFDNLRLLEEHKPIAFDLAPYGTTGQLLIAYGDLAIAEALAAAMPDHRVITLHPNTMAALRRGEVIDVPFSSLDVTELSRAMLFAGTTEHAMLDALRGAGMLKGTKIEGEAEYARHQRNEVDDCEACRERRDAIAALPLRERIYRHPNLVAFGVLLFAALVTLLVKAIR